MKRMSQMLMVLAFALLLALDASAQVRIMTPSITPPALTPS